MLGRSPISGLPISGLGFAYSLSLVTGAFTQTGTAVNLGVTIPGATQTYTETGFSAGLTAQRKLTAVTQSFAETGSNASVVAQRKVTATSNSFSLTGQNTTLGVARKLPATTQSYAETGTNTSVIAQRKITATSNSFILTGQSATLGAARSLPAVAGSFSVTGQGATIPAGRKLSASPAAFVDFGSVSDLKTARYLGLVSEPFTYSGTATSTLSARNLTADTGGFSVTDNDASLYSGVILETLSGAFIQTPSDVSLLVGRVTSLQPGSFGLSASNTSFPATRIFVTDSVGFGFDGANAALVYTQVGSVYLPSESFRAEANDAGLVVGHKVELSATSFDVNPSSTSFNYSRTLQLASGLFSLGSYPSYRQLSIPMFSGMFEIAGTDARSPQYPRITPSVTTGEITLKSTSSSGIVEIPSEGTIGGALIASQPVPSTVTSTVGAPMFAVRITPSLITGAMTLKSARSAGLTLLSNEGALSGPSIDSQPVPSTVTSTPSPTIHEGNIE